MFRLLHFDESVPVSQFFHDWVVSVPCEHAVKQSSIFGKFDFVIERGENRYPSSLCSPKIVLAVSR
jgi:hypothetical protein